jgi:tetratricopeptide (TPR) repeat protein
VSELSELAEYVGGYPPAAHFAINQAKNYGLDLLMANKTRLVEFQTTTFLRHFAELSLKEEERNLLRLLSFYSPLPLSAMGKTLGLGKRVLSDIIVKLIDLSLITIDSDGYYQIAEPVMRAAVRAFGLPPDAVHKKLANELSSFLKQSTKDAKGLTLYRVLFQSATLASDQNIAKEAIHLSNDLIRLTETLYHSRRYEDAAKIGYLAVKERPDNATARSYLIRSLVQQEKWEEAENQLEELEQLAPLRNVLFLRGFLERKRHRIPEAISAYTESQIQGRDGVAIRRELALCYFHQHQLDLASMHVKEALKKSPDNSYVLDLWAQIAIRQKDKKVIDEALSRLELVNPMTYYHRKSRAHLADNQIQEAESAAQHAIDCEASPPFEMQAQLVHCKILLKKITEARTLLTKIDKKFGRTHNDIRWGLRCRLEITCENYKEALQHSKKIRNKNTYQYKNIRKDALEGELQHSALKDKVRATYSQELRNLGRGLGSVSPDELLPIDLDMSADGD